MKSSMKSMMIKTAALALSAALAAPVHAMKPRSVAPVASAPGASVLRVSLPFISVSLQAGQLPTVPAAGTMIGADAARFPAPALRVLAPVVPGALPFGSPLADISVPAGSRIMIVGGERLPEATRERLQTVGERLANFEGAGEKDGADGAKSAGGEIERAMTGEAASASGEAAQPAAPAQPSLAQQVKSAKATVDKILGEVGKVIIGQEDMKRGILMAMIARQHALLEGLPGVAKTETAKAFADAVEGAFQRVQGTPDKLPSDILGAEVLQEDPETGKKSFELSKGPVFTNLLLVDEINRMPPKAQAALLEAMAEGRVTIGRQTIELGRFTVLATQNPVEQDGTYRLPEAQLDRFMLKLLVPQPSAEDMKRIMRLNRAKAKRPRASKVTTLDELDRMREIAEKLPMTDEIEDYIVRVAMAASQEKEIKGSVSYSVYTRAVQFLDTAARVHALMEGRDYVDEGDVRAVAPMVLRHRIVPDYQSNQTPETIIDAILDRVPVEGNPSAVPPKIIQ